ncbi:unnamed protein product, partial [Didymodactylos carnosus]
VEERLKEIQIELECEKNQKGDEEKQLQKGKEKFRCQRQKEKQQLRSKGTAEETRLQNERQASQHPMIGRMYTLRQSMNLILVTTNYLQNEQSSLSQIRDENPLEAHKLDSEVLWSNALLKAQGATVRDKVQMLKKSIKKQKKLKQRSTKKWQERLEQTEKLHSDKQQKRVENLQKRKDEKKAKQKKRAIKRGRLVK